MEISKLNWINPLCQRLCNDRDLGNDLYQELFLILLEKPEKWLVDAQQGGYLFGMCIRIVQQQYFGNRTRFQKYFKNSVGIFDITEIQNNEIPEPENYQIGIDLVYYQIENKLKTLGDYERRLLELYFFGDDKIKALSMRSLSTATKISRHEITRVFNNFKDECNNSIDWNSFLCELPSSDVF